MTLSLAQQAPSFELQAVALVIAALGAVMPIAVAIVVSGFTRRNALRDLRNKELIRVHEGVIEGIAAFGTAAVQHRLLFEHHVALQAKFAVARIHAGPNLSQCLEGIEKWAMKVFDLSRAAIAAVQSGGDGRAEQDALMQEAGKMLALIEILADHITIQLGPTYGESGSWLQDFKVGAIYAFLKARERMFREWDRDQKRAKQRQQRRDAGGKPPAGDAAG